METKKIEITCEGNSLIDYHDLYDLQGDLKYLSETNKGKLKESILKFGFSFPACAWKDKTGKMWTIDGHQRLKILAVMESEGYEIPLIPCDFTQAKDKKEARIKLLHLNSRYGLITQAGFENFTFDLDLPDFQDLLEIPEIGFNLEQINIDDFFNSELNKTNNKEAKKIKCPKCGEIFEI